MFEYERTRELDVINRSNLGSFYKFLNNKLTCKSGVGPLRLDTGILATDDTIKATALNDYFCSVFTHDDGRLPVFPRRVANNVSIDTIDFSPSVILKALKSYKHVSNARDPDGFTSAVVKKIMYSLVNPLCVLFKFVFSSGTIPVSWKTANVMPIFKKGISSCLSNYRPISLTSVFCKIYERVIKDQMLVYLLQHKLINHSQHGFLSRHSTCTQLLETINDWSIALRNHHAVDAVYFDFAKAFDSVSHTKLLHKLAGYGITGDLFNCLTDFLHNRIQRVVLPNGVSSFKSVLSGVPQGSVLGPLLFLLYINDITDLFTGAVNIKLFADDIKIYLEITDNSDFAVFQNSIDDIAYWASTWQLKLAINKCQHIRISLSRSVVSQQFSLNSSLLSSCNSCRDLGVIVDSRLSFSEQVNSMVAKAHLRASQILRCFLSRDPYILIKAFNVYVRPLVEYCSPVWSPTAVGRINKIESVQRWFTKRIRSISKLSYDDRLLKLGNERLELRRIRADLLMCYKIIHKFVDIPQDDFFLLSNLTKTRGNSLKLVVPISRVDARADFFSVRIINIWNKLSDDVVTAPSISAFLSNLNNIDLKFAMLGKL